MNYDKTTLLIFKQYTPHASDLGRVVQAVIREFEKNPPPLLVDTKYQSVGSESIMPELQNLNIHQLEMLLKDDAYFEDFVEEVPLVMRQLNDSLDELIVDVEKIASKDLKILN